MTNIYSVTIIIFRRFLEPYTIISTAIRRKKVKNFQLIKFHLLVLICIDIKAFKFNFIKLLISSNNNKIEVFE